VLRAVDDLDYRPNLLARNLRRQKVDMIGVLVTDIENPHFTQMVRAVEDAAFRLGYRVQICNTDEDAEKQRAYLDVLAQERALGVIMTPSNPYGPEITELLDLGIPVVAFDRPVADPRADSVVVDNVAAGRLAAACLIQAGHTRIALIGDPTVETGAAREQGYSEAMRAAGLQPLIVPGRSRIEGGAEAAERLARDHAPTALVLGNNLMALGALQALRSRRLRVPADIALVTIDNPSWTEVTDPPLTVLAQPVRRMAQAVFDLLLERLQSGRTQTRHVVYECELIVRDSVRPRSPVAPPA
jgi:DNA-binding LacI/PurR family transcriptional regulator